MCRRRVPHMWGRSGHSTGSSLGNVLDSAGAMVGLHIIDRFGAVARYLTCFAHWRGETWLRKMSGIRTTGPITTTRRQCQGKTNTVQPTRLARTLVATKAVKARTSRRLRHCWEGWPVSRFAQARWRRSGNEDVQARARRRQTACEELNCLPLPGGIEPHDQYRDVIAAPRLICL